ncbi:hypothetical protein [Microcoleus sp. bin38.metabat.b11b12b14.051]|uniref:hypothetical protein n=1 Tax=Microcoleus sp. bin38.metabat.b11b12b14.051 TaxID=2742709 RepID=UPI0025E7725E|nr:hypothetical protein [Microcoleus sp. bin38.metabat.b11b12b14.051]
MFEKKKRGDRPFFAGAIAHENKQRAIALRNGYASRPLCDHHPLKWWKWLGLSVEREVGRHEG